MQTVNQFFNITIAYMLNLHLRAEHLLLHFLNYILCKWNMIKNCTCISSVLSEFGFLKFWHLPGDDLRSQIWPHVYYACLLPFSDRMLAPCSSSQYNKYKFETIIGRDSAMTERTIALRHQKSSPISFRSTFLIPKQGLGSLPSIDTCFPSLWRMAAHPLQLSRTIEYPSCLSPLFSMDFDHPNAHENI